MPIRAKEGALVSFYKAVSAGSPRALDRRACGRGCSTGVAVTRADARRA